MIVIADFAENYSFILQDAAQGFHWYNDQATLHSFVCHYRRGTELEHINLVISSNLKLIIVLAFQKRMFVSGGGVANTSLLFYGQSISTSNFASRSSSPFFLSSSLLLIAYSRVHPCVCL